MVWTNALLSCWMWIHGLPPDSAPDPGPVPGTVSMPLDLYTTLQEAADLPRKLPPPDTTYCSQQRKIEGSFRKGLLSATLDTRFEVLDDRGYVQIPVLDAEASLQEVRLDERPASLIRDGEMYVLGVQRPGIYHLTVRFLLGQEQDRFARRLQFKLPPAGSTHLALWLPEHEIEPKLLNGAVLSLQTMEEGTQLEAQLDATGVFDLSWTRRLTHVAQEQVRLEAQLNTLFTIHEAMVTGLAVFDLKVVEGETDRIDLRLPPDLEVVRVEGEAILQWHTEASEGGRLILLLRYLATDQVRVAVHFQYPADADHPVILRLPMPPDGVATTGAAGVQAPAGLNVRVTGQQGAETLSVRDLPVELTDLTKQPLLFGFKFQSAPSVTLSVARHQQVELTGTVIDEIEASSLVLEDGTEISKIKLHIRNNTRQYLTLQLPDGSLLTHSLIDGQPIRPAVAPVDGKEALLFPLRQSDRLDRDSQRLHTVQRGETLGDIANLYYSDPARWPVLLDNNKSVLANDTDLRVGQQLVIPAAKGLTLEESHFVIELAYKRQSAALSDWGTISVRLPLCDVDSMKVTWHIFLPESVLPLMFDGNLTPLSAIRYDPFRRMRDFLKEAFSNPQAWAGENYRSILLQRKDIFQAEAQKKGGGEVILASFPLVGQRYRFKRILAGHDAAAMTVYYVAQSLATVARWVAFILAFGSTLLLLSFRRRWWAWAAVLIGASAMLVAGYFILGIHRRLIWGADLALLISVLRLQARPWWNAILRRLREPWTLTETLTLRNLIILLGLLAVLRFMVHFPLLWSLTLLVGLTLVWYQALRRTHQEVNHAR